MPTAPFDFHIFQQDMAISRRQDSTILLGKECNYANQLIMGRSSLQQGSPSKHWMPSAPFDFHIFQQDMAISRRQDSTILLGKVCHYAIQLILGRISLLQRSPSTHLMPSAPLDFHIFIQYIVLLHTSALADVVA